MKGANIIECPGAWYGWQPRLGPDRVNSYADGHVIVDPRRIVDAVRWLSRRFSVGSTKLTEDKGICINLNLRKVEVAA